MNTTSRLASRLSLALVAGALAVPMAMSPAAATGPQIGGEGSKYFLTNSFTSHGTEVHYGRDGDQTFVGDWNGDGRDTLAVRRGRTFHLNNSATGGQADVTFSYGNTNDVVVMGDWNGDGVDTPAVRRGSVYHIRNSHTDGGAEFTVQFGRADDEVLVGDWNGDGRDTLAIRRGSEFHLQGSIRESATSEVRRFGDGSGDAISGSWNGSKRDGVGYRNGTVAHMQTADGKTLKQSYGRAGDSVFTGDFNGSGSDALGVRRPAPRPVAAAATNAAEVQAQAGSNRSQQVLNVARSRTGAPYGYGASGPDRFDCSGFTSYVYRTAAGLNLPRTSGQQRSWAATHGTRVPMSQARPGDLLWWPGHVAIYTGPGRLIDASTPGTTITERRLWGNPEVYRIL